MATYIETKDIKILINPSTVFNLKGYGLPTHKKELDAFNKF
jgi:predicted metallo-beta-lactamase superfamily hydrolase